MRAGKADLGFVMAQKRSEPLFYTELQRVTWCALGHGLARWQARASSGRAIPPDEPTPDPAGARHPDPGIDRPSCPCSVCRAAASWRWGAWMPSLTGPRRALASPSCRISPLHPRLQTAPVTRLTDFPGTSLGYVVRQNQVLSRAIKQLLHWVEEEILLNGP